MATPLRGQTRRVVFRRQPADQVLHATPGQRSALPEGRSGGCYCAFTSDYPASTYRSKVLLPSSLSNTSDAESTMACVVKE